MILSQVFKITNSRYKDKDYSFFLSKQDTGGVSKHINSNG